MGKRVLLADDSATIQKLVEMALSDTDFQLLAVSDGKQAIDQLEAFQPDVILADAIMPEMDGYDVCQYVKSHSRFRNIPVILLTGRFQPFDEKRAVEVEIDDRVVKPFSQTQLVSLINASMTKAMPAASSPEMHEDAPIFDPKEFAMPAPEPANLDFNPPPAPEPIVEPTPAPASDISSLDFGLTQTPSFTDDDLPSATPSFEEPASPMSFDEPASAASMNFENETVRIDPAELPDELRRNFASFRNSEADDGFLDPHRPPEPEPVVETPVESPPQQEFLETTMELTVDDLEDIDEVMDSERVLEEEPMDLGDDDLEEVDDLPMANFDTGPVEMLEPEPVDDDIDTAPVDMMAVHSVLQEEPASIVEEPIVAPVFDTPDEVVEQAEELEETEDVDPQGMTEPMVAFQEPIAMPPTADPVVAFASDEPAIAETEEDDPLAVEEEFSVEFDLKPDTESEEQLLDEVEVGDAPRPSWSEPAAASPLPAVPQPVLAEFAAPQPLEPAAVEPLFEAASELSPAEPVVVPDEPDPIDLGSVGETFEAPEEPVDELLAEVEDSPALDDSGDMLVFEEDDSQPSLESLLEDDSHMPTQKLAEVEMAERIDAEMAADSPLEDTPSAVEPVPAEPDPVAEVPAPAADVAPVAPAPGGTFTLSEEQMETLVDRIAARVIERMGKDSIRDIAWEIIPDLSEALIKKRIYQLENAVDEE